MASKQDILQVLKGGIKIGSTHVRIINPEKTFDVANYKFNPNKPGIFQWQSVDDVFLMVVD